ncbi:Uncharacterised protein [Streptococcus pneumoniae]|nr:Uncharacterised protein [Streptococcus pneumoniae]
MIKTFLSALSVILFVIPIIAYSFYCLPYRLSTTQVKKVQFKIEMIKRHRNARQLYYKRQTFDNR